MIIVDTNAIAHLTIPSDQTEYAERLMGSDTDWHSPVLWRSEFANVIAKHVRFSNWSLGQAKSTFENAELAIIQTHSTNFERVLSLVKSSKCTAYDCEFIALAIELNCKLVTLDKKILSEFPNIAVSLLDF